MNDINEYNVNGWATIHEAAYNGAADEINAILEHGRELHRNVIDMKTVDDMKTTPLLIAALGGHLEIMKLLLQNGADINGQLTFRSIIQHGLCEVATIRQDFELLTFLYDKFPDLAARVINLMISDKLDDESRIAVGRTVEILSQEYGSLNIKPAAGTTNNNLSIKQQIAKDLFDSDQFATSLIQFFNIGFNADEVTVSTVMVLLNVMTNEKFQENFMKSKGIETFLTFMKDEKLKLKKKIEAYRKKFNLIPKKKKRPETIKVTELDRIKSENNYQSNINNDNEAVEKLKKKEKTELMDDFDDGDQEDLISMQCETYIGCACIGQALGIFSKLEKYLNYIVSENFGDQIVDYVNTLFDWNQLCKDYNIFETVNNSHNNKPESLNENQDEINSNDDNHPILFEQYICSYLNCMSSLVFTHYHIKQCFYKANIFEKVMDFWLQLGYLAENNKNLNLKINLNTTTAADTEHQEENNENEETGSSHSIIEEKEVIDLKITSLNRILDKLSVNLIKQLKLATIECIGKVLYNFEQLKEKYIFSVQPPSYEIMNHKFNAQLKDWPKITNEFIKQLITYLDSSVCLDRELQLEVIKFLRHICFDETVNYKMQLKLIDQREVNSSSLINSLRSLLRKSTLESIRTNAMHLLWSLTGSEHYHIYHDRKSCIYRAIGASRFIDTLFDGDDDINSICLEALESILNSPPHRDTHTHQLVKIQDETGRLHAIPAILRLLKSNNENLLVLALKCIVAACVSTGYCISNKNQMIVTKQSGIPAILDLAKSKQSSNLLKIEAYYTLSMICLNNNSNKQTMLESIEYRVDILIYEIRSIWLNLKPKLNLTQNEEIKDLEIQFKAGLTLCAFCFKTEDFTRKILSSFGRENWAYFKQVIDKLNNLFQKNQLNKAEKACFEIQKLKCYFGFQIAALNNLINYSQEDPRAIGLKLMIDIIPKSKNTYLKSIAADYMGRVILFDDCLLDCFIAINAIEILALSTNNNEDDKTRGEAEIGSASITLGFFTNLHPEARRRLLKLSRKNFKIMDALKYSNELINLDLKRAWIHFKELNNSIYQTPASHNLNNNSKQQFKYSKLPPIK